ncbi:MAG TPA: DJ-1/PfpI family protein [Steroidobacter sp.]
MGCGAQSGSPANTDPVEAERQARAFVEALQPSEPGKPIVAVVARNEATETTDFLLTHAVLKRSGVADVHAVAPRRGRVQLYPVLQVEVDEDFAEFEKAYPSGADYVIVPAMDDADDPVITKWLQQQADRGARIIGVCAGALIVAKAGLLDNRRFVTHWFYPDKVMERNPTAVHVPNQRYVVDGNVATTTGITASIPAMLALVEAIGGRERAEVLAEQLGVESWTPAHDSSKFGLHPSRMWNYIVTTLAFWRHETWSIDVHEGMDDIALALTADAWSRTGLVDVEASAPRAVRLRSGLVLAARPIEEADAPVRLDPALKSVRQLDRTLCEIGERFGPASRERVMAELEYPGIDATGWLEPACGKQDREVTPESRASSR